MKMIRTIDREGPESGVDLQPRWVRLFYLLSEGVEEDLRVEHCGEGEGLRERGAA